MLLLLLPGMLCGIYRASACVRKPSTIKCLNTKIGPLSTLYSSTYFKFLNSNSKICRIQYQSSCFKHENFDNNSSVTPTDDHICSYDRIK